MRGRRQELYQERRGCHQLLEVIEDEQQAFVAQIALQRQHQRLVGCFLHTQRLRDGGQQHVGSADGCQRNETHAIREVAVQPLAGGKAKARLTGARWST